MLMRSGKLSQTTQFEPRWPIVLQVVVVFVLLAAPARVRLLPVWLGYAVGILFILPTMGVSLSGARLWWLRFERITMLVCATFAEAVTLVTLGYLIAGMLKEPQGFSGRQLFASSVGAWVTNVVVFSVIYWQIDRGGPEARVNGQCKKPEWLFPEAGVPEGASPEWQPASVDYLFLSFCTATAFSPTDVLPLTGRAKMLMMLESAVSLGTLVIVASRAINILGG